MITERQLDDMEAQAEVIVMKTLLKLTEQHKDLRMEIPNVTGRESNQPESVQAEVAGDQEGFPGQG